MVAIWAVFAAPANAGETWRRAESPHFVVYSSAKEPVLRDYVLMLEDFDAMLRVAHARPLDEPVANKLSVYLVEDAAAFRRVYPEAAPAIRGAYFAVEDDIFLLAVRAGEAARRSDATHGDDVVLHEYTHHFLQHYYPNGYPSWFNEGYAEYYMTADLGRAGVTVGAGNPSRLQTLASGQKLGTWLPMRSILVGDVNRYPDALLETFYSESWLLTHYLMDAPQRRAGMNRYLAALKGGAEPLKAWSEIFGQTPEELDTALKAYLKQPLPAARLARTWTEPQVSLAVLTPGAAEVLLDNQLFKKSAPGPLIQSALQRVHQTAERYPDDHAVRIALARGEMKSGDTAAAEASLRPMIAENPKDAEALRLLALSRITDAANGEAGRANAYREALSLLTEAARLEPDNNQTLFRLAQMKAVQPGYSGGDALALMKRAVALAPQVFSLRTGAAGIAIRRGDVRLAREFLEPVAAASNGGRLTTEARQMLAGLDGLIARPVSVPTPPEPAPPAVVFHRLGPP